MYTLFETREFQTQLLQPIPLGVTFSNAVSKLKAQKLERLFSLKRGKRDVRALSFELSKMSPQVGLAVHYFLKSNSKSHHHLKVAKHAKRYTNACIFFPKSGLLPRNMGLV